MENLIDNTSSEVTTPSPSGRAGGGSSGGGSSEGGLSSIMFAGTGSDVGKSVVATAFCRIFKQDGYHPAPFKAQNMALNSYATADGLEIGRAQAVQAEAAGVACETDMNPLLLKPNSDHSSQVVLNGKPIGNQHARKYFRKEGREVLRQAVHEAFDRLSQRYMLRHLSYWLQILKEAVFSHPFMAHSCCSQKKNENS